jgi:hypothetical protein
MPHPNPGRPDPSEYPPYAAAYVDLVQGDDILRLLSGQAEDTVGLFQSIGAERAGAFRYAPDKWTASQVLGHVIDTERIFAYRALRVARNDGAPSPGFEQDDYVRFGPFDHCSLDSLVDEFRVVRAASLALYRNLQPEAWMRRGVANRFNVTVRGLAFLTAGHELHHAKILREKYLS